MLIENILNVIYGVFELLTRPISIPQFPSSLQDYLDTAFSYLETGAAIAANYVNLPFLLSVFGIILAVDIGINIYHLVMWILRKIPFLGIE